MFNWFDLMRQAQASAGLEVLMRQYQLSADQAQKALAATVPAFALGLQHAMATGDPARFFQAMMSGNYQDFWRAAGSSFTARAQQEGHRLLDQIFSSDEVSRRVAHQAADYAGLSLETMQQILPLLAGILAGGISQWMNAQMRAVQASPPAESEKVGQTAANPWVDLWAQWMQAASPERKPAAAPFETMMADFLRTAQPQKPTERAPSPFADWQDMVTKGSEAQVQYLAALQNIFDNAWKDAPKKRTGKKS